MEKENPSAGENGAGAGMSIAADTTSHSTEAARSRALSRRLRHAKALWDVELYDPARGGEDLPDEINYPLMRAHEVAMYDFLLHPAGDLSNVHEKLDTLLREYLCCEAADCVRAILRDVEDLIVEARHD